MQEICEIADRENVDAVLVAGDLFDTYNPPVESVELFYKTLKRLAKNGQRPVIAIAGNHDSPDRIEAPDPLARECGILFAGYIDSHITPFALDTGLEVTKSEPGFIELRLPGNAAPLRVILAPYANEHRVRKYLGRENPEEELRQLLQEHWQGIADRHCDDKGVNVMVAHLFMVKKGEPLPDEHLDEERPIVGMGQQVWTENIPPQIQYTAMGHLHRKQIVDERNGIVAYSSSPLAYSFAEAGVDKFVVIVDAVPGVKISMKPVKLEKGRRLLRARFDDMDAAVQWLQEHADALVELTMVSDTFLTGDERKRLNGAHPNIITLIPEVKSKDEVLTTSGKQLDISKRIEDLFADYFKYKKGQQPNDELMELFKEALNAGEEAEA